MYTIKALHNSYISPSVTIPALAMYFQAKMDQTLDSVFGYVWLVKGQGKTIVVDTGIGSPPGAAQRGEPEIIGDFVVDAGKDTVSLLQSERLAPKDADFVILTHLHWAHCANIKLFPKARILISRRGWRDVVAPEHRDLVPQDGFPRSVLAYLIDEAWERVEFLPEEADILPGLKVFWVGGHSPCSQAVKISTTKG